MSKPITLWAHAVGPNPWKVVILLEELGIKYDQKMLEMSELKKPAFEKVNPNGRVPAIEDPNTGITLWESGAIYEYLIETYDKDHKLSSSSFPDKFLQKQWLFFQVSGQGPYFGQAAWFDNFHHEKLPSAIERYQNEVKRVTKVLDSALTDKEYLVGGKCSYADLSFLPWLMGLPFIFKTDGVEWVKEYPAYNAWVERLMARPAVKKMAEMKQKASGH